MLEIVKNVKNTNCVYAAQLEIELCPKMETANSKV